MDTSTAPTAIPNLVEMVVATTRYLGALSDLTDEDMRAPSLLPGWTRGHVVTHLARNADAFCNLLHWAESGQEHYMYDSREQRNADIEAGYRHSVALCMTIAALQTGQRITFDDARQEVVAGARRT